MAKRGTALLDIKTTDELLKFLQAECLIVLNVYSGFYGPCNALASNLRDFKMMTAGDDLQLATVNVDDIDVFKRFRKKGEPAYLIILNGKIVNSFYGCNLTALLNLIKEELNLYKSGESLNRPIADLKEMSQLEAYRFRINRERLIKYRKLDQAKKQQLVYDFRIMLTNNIMDNTADIGVTVFMPHVLNDDLNDLLFNLTEATTEMQMVLKQHVIAPITKDDLEIINFDAENLSPMVYSHIRGHDVLIVAWKMGSMELKPINEIFDEFALNLSEELPFEKKVVKKGKGKGKKKKSKQVEEVIPIENPEGEGEEEQKPPFKLPPITVPLDTIDKVRFDPVQIEPIDLQFIEDEKDIIGLINESIIGFTNQRIVNMHNDCIKTELGILIDNLDKDIDGDGKSKKKKKKTVTKVSGLGNIAFNPKEKHLAYVRPIWTPPTPRAHAAMLYVYFRKLLSFFLPLDPPGADRFVIVVFNIPKHQEILEFMADNPKLCRDGILAHGFFRGFVNGENFTNTILLCKTGIEYRLLPEQEPNDKMILKVVAQSEALLGLIALEPEFVSQNEHDGQMECDVIFPLGYTSVSEEEMESEMKFDDAFEDGAEIDGENAPENSTKQTTEVTSGLEPQIEAITEVQTDTSAPESQPESHTDDQIVEVTSIPDPQSELLTEEGIIEGTLETELHTEPIENQQE